MRYHFVYIRTQVLKGGSAMNVIVKIDWKFAVAVGVAISCISLALKVNDMAAERVLTCAVDAYRDIGIAANRLSS